MRRILCAGLILLVIVLTCGCTEPVKTPEPQTPAVTLFATPLPVATPPSQVQKQVNLTAWQTKTEVIVQLNGGADASELTALNIRIDNQNGENIQRTVHDPFIGQKIIFAYQGNANANVVNIVGVFKDGTQQTVLMKYF